MESQSLVRTRYRLVIRRPGTSVSRDLLNAGPGTIHIERGRFTREAAVLDVEVLSRAEDLPRVATQLLRRAELARTLPA